MAFEMTVETRYGGEVPAYLKVAEMRGDKNWLRFSVKGYLSREAAQEGKADVWEKTFAFVPSGEERWDRQAYIYCRSQELFSDAVDILEEHPADALEEENIC